jgi:hypothetical protein
LLAFILLALALVAVPDTVTRIGIFILTSLIALDAQRRNTVHYVHPWLFFLAALVAIGMLSSDWHVAVVTGLAIAIAVIILLTIPYRLSGVRPSRKHLLTSIVFAEALLVVSLVNGAPALQAAVTVLPVLATEELMHSIRPNWWSILLPFAILTLIIFVALALGASYRLS